MSLPCAEAVYTYKAAYSKMPVLFSIKYGEGQTHTTRNQLWQYILTLANATNYIDITLGPLSSNSKFCNL